MPTDWQSHEDLTHGGSSPAEDWREPMVDASNSSNLTVREMMDDAIHRARAAAAGVDAGKLVDERIAELEAELELERRAVEVLANALVMSGSCMLGYDHTSLSDCSLSTNCRACWAAWARKQAREEGGVKPDTERSE